MRTTIELTPEAWHLAKSVAHERNQSLGRIVSEFILRRFPTEASVPATSRAGFPVFRSGKPITSEGVAALLDEDGPEGG